MRASWILFLLTVLKSWSFSGVQAQPFESGARARALGGVRVVGSFQAGNPAAWVTVQKWAVAFGYVRPFGLAALQGSGMLGVGRTPWGVGSIALRQAGFEQYKEVQIGVGWSYRFQMPFQTQLAVGIQGYRQHIRISRYGSKGWWGVLLGWELYIAEHLVVGGQLLNPHRAQHPFRRPLPQEIQVGIAYQPVKTVWILGALRKELGYALEPQAGIEVQWVPWMAIRAGMQALDRFAIGFGFFVKGIRVDFSLASHPWLGWTPAFSIAIQR